MTSEFEGFFADLDFCHEFIRAQQRNLDELHADFCTTEAALAASRGEVAVLREHLTEALDTLEQFGMQKPAARLTLEAPHESTPRKETK